VATFVKCTRLQGVINSNAASGSVSATAGNTLIALSGVYYGGASATPTMTMTGGGTWVTDARNHQHFTSSNDNFSMGFASVLSATGGTATMTVTWSNSATNSVAEAYIYEFSGMPTSSILDTGSTPVGQQGSASPVTTSSLTNANAADVMLAIGVTYSSGNEVHGAPTNSWTMPTNGDETSGSALTSVTAYKIVAASAAQSTSWTDSPSVPWTAFIAAYKAVASTTYSLTRSVTQGQSVSVVAGQVIKRTVTATQATSATVAVHKSVKYTQTVSLTQGTSLQLGTSSVVLPTNYYTTTFPLAENPINEGGIWTLGGRDGLDWTSPRTVTNKAFGVQSGTDSPPYTDGIAVLKGTWGNDQEVSATVFSTVGNGGYYTEVELLLRFTVTPHSTTGYEITLNTNPVNSYIEVNKWNGGAYGSSTSYVQLTPTATGTVVNGDVVKATINGTTIRVYRNGTLVLTVTDASYASGKPGMGFFNSDNGNHADPTTFGFTNFTAHTVGAPIPITRSVTQGQAVSLTRKPSLTRALTQAQSVVATRQGRLSRLLSQSQALSLSRGSSASTQTVTAIVQTAVSIQVRQVKVQTLTVLQAVSATLVKQVRTVRTLSQVTGLLRSQRIAAQRALGVGESVSLQSGSTTVYSVVGFAAVGTRASGTVTGVPLPPEPGPEPEPIPETPTFEPFDDGLAPALGRASVPSAPVLLPYRRTGSR